MKNKLMCSYDESFSKRVIRIELKSKCEYFYCQSLQPQQMSGSGSLPNLDICTSKVWVFYEAFRFKNSLN